MSKVDQDGPNGCWLWLGTKNAEGYGVTNLMAVSGDRLAHRISYHLNHGPILNGLVICHHCDNPSCVNPSHLYMGTAKNNVDDCVRRKRHFTPFVKSDRCRRGHLFDEKNTYIKPNGHRTCKICAAAGHKERKMINKRRLENASR